MDDSDITSRYTLRLTVLGSYPSPEFVSIGHNVVLNVRPGREGIHLAMKYWAT